MLSFEVWIYGIWDRVSSSRSKCVKYRIQTYLWSITCYNNDKNYLDTNAVIVLGGFKHLAVFSPSNTIFSNPLHSPSLTSFCNPSFTTFFSQPFPLVFCLHSISLSFLKLPFNLPTTKLIPLFSLSDLSHAFCSPFSSQLTSLEFKLLFLVQLTIIKSSKWWKCPSQIQMDKV